MAHTVLLIDYNPHSIDSIGKLLKPAEIRLVVAKDGQAGLDEFRRSRPDLTVVQDLIPLVHGLDVCREIKRSEGGAGHPVVLLSSPRSHAVLVNTGCDAYLKKPFHNEELLRVLARLLPGGLVPRSTEALATAVG